MPRRKAAILLLVPAAILLAVWMALRFESVDTHPIFGSIRQTVASDANDARPDPFGKFLRRSLPPHLVSSRSFPYDFKDQPRYLRLGGYRMEWSLGGWLYFHEPDTALANAWEFAPSSATNLLEVTTDSLPTHFYGRNDTNLQKAFGFMSNTNALHVQRGQVLFARHQEDPSRVFMLHAFREEGNRLMVRYCSVASVN
jgi:hypothetical protein